MRRARAAHDHQLADRERAVAHAHDIADSQSVATSMASGLSQRALGAAVEELEQSKQVTRALLI